MLMQLWNDETGFLVSAELVLVATILVVGCISGMTMIRDAVCGEMADVANAVSSLDQSYSFSSVKSSNAWTAGSSFQNAPRVATVSYNNTCVQVCEPYHG